MKTSHYTRKKRLLSRFVEKLKVKMAIPGQAPAAIHRIKLKIKFLLRELSGFVPKHQLKKILGVFAVVFGFVGTSNAQLFSAPVQNPFGLVPPTSSYLLFQEIADLDGDGDLDILASAYNGDILYFKNTGTSAAPAFAAPIANPFGLVGSQYLDIPALADLDGDGDLDLLLGQYYGSMTYHENVGTATAPSFAAGISLPFGLTGTYYLAFPEFADLDGDGDFDLLVGEAYANLQYFENVGTATAPSFAAPVMNPFGLVAGYGISQPEFGDLDYDGDLDLLVGESYGQFSYFENTGTSTNPAFSTPVTNPFGLTPTYYFAFPALADLDNDGDLDLMVSEYYGIFQYFKNIEPTTSLAELALNGSLDPNPFTDLLNFNFDQDVVHAEFVNLAGQTVLDIQNPKGEVDVSSIDPGVYIVKCTNVHKQQSTFKLQKL